MEKSTIVAVDMHDQNCRVKWVIDRGEAARFTFTNTRAGREVFRQKLQQIGQEHGCMRIVVGYEASGCGFTLRDELKAAGIECYVLAPTKMGKSAQRRRQKTDDKDCNDILEILRGFVLAGNELPSIWVPEEQTRDDREITRTRADLAYKLSRTKVQIQSLLKFHGIERPSEIGEGNTKSYRNWLTGLSAAKAEETFGLRTALGTLMRQWEFLLGELKILEEALTALAAKDRYAKKVETLTKRFKGVGVLSALTFLVEIGLATRFKNRRQVGNFLGLAPSANESGKVTDCKGHITKQGSAFIRRVLCQCAWARARWDAHERELADRIKKKNPKKSKIALVALMRRLGIAMWHATVELELAA